MLFPGNERHHEPEPYFMAGASFSVRSVAVPAVTYGVYSVVRGCTRVYGGVYTGVYTGYVHVFYLFYLRIYAFLNVCTAFTSLSYLFYIIYPGPGNTGTSSWLR